MAKKWWECMLIAMLVHVLVSSNLCNSENCESLAGTWYNSLGSEIILEHNTDGSLQGEYRTAVERSTGSAGSTHSLIHGASPKKAGSVFAFAVMWRQGASTTAWTGQCQMCGDEKDKEVLITSWVLRSQVWSCQDKWKSTLIGQDYFTREEQKEGPRKDDDTHTPQDVDNNNRLRKRDVAMREERQAGAPPCSFEGDWYNELGSQIQLQHGDDSYITGHYTTSADLENGQSDVQQHTVYGVGNTDDQNTTMALFVAWNGGVSVTGWVGQCHLCGENNDIETIETTWLLRQSVDTCHSNWKATLHGQNSFTRELDDNAIQQILGIHTPSQEGEDEASIGVDSPCSGSVLTPWMTLAVFMSQLAAPIATV